MSFFHSYHFSSILALYSCCNDTNVPTVRLTTPFNSIVFYSQCALGCLCCFRYQVLDQSLQLLLGLTDRLLLPHDGDQLLLRVVRCWKDDPGARPVPHATDVGPTTADEELVVLGFGVELSGEVVDLL